jgi:uncharacterized protein
MNYPKIEKHILSMLKKGLNKSLHYHGFPHTIDVINNVMFLSEKINISSSDVKLLKLAALFHDLGFLESYQGHEEVGCSMAKEILPLYDINQPEIELICNMIMATKIPQAPKTILEKILADADLLYLGTDEFEKIGNTLFLELKENGKLDNEVSWNELQVNFLKKHHFHTEYAIQNFSQKKAENLHKTEQWLIKNKAIH